MVDSLVVQEVCWNGLLNDLLLDLASEVFRGDGLSVLSRDDNSVDTLWNDGTIVMLVLDSDLGLGVRPEPWELSALASLLHGGVQLVCQQNSQWEQLRRLIGSIAKHDALVSGTELLEDLLIVETLCDIGALLFNGDEDVASLVVESLGGVIVANVLDGLANDLLVIETCLCGDFSKDHDHTRLGGSLAGDLGRWVLSQAGIEDGIRDLIRDLVGVATTDGLGGEEKGALAAGDVSVESM